MKHIAWKVAAVVTAVLVMLWSTRARAQEEGWSVAVAGGAYFPDTGGALKKELDPGMGGELRLGWQGASGFAFEAAAGGLHADHFLPPVDVSETTMHAVTASYGLLTATTSFAPGGGRWQLRAGAGAGYYRFRASLKDPPPDGERRGSESDIGFHLQGGVQFALTQRWALGLDYRWVSVSPDGVDLGGNLVLASAQLRL